MNSSYKNSESRKKNRAGFSTFLVKRVLIKTDGFLPQDTVLAVGAGACADKNI